MTRQDVHNMINRKTREGKQETVEVKVEQFLKEFVASDPCNASHLFVDGSGVARCLTLQTSGMHNMFHLFPEVLLVDTTHKTNDLNYKLFGFMVHDAFRAGQFVHHAFGDAEPRRTYTTQ